MALNATTGKFRVLAVAAAISLAAAAVAAWILSMPKPDAPVGSTTSSQASRISAGQGAPEATEDSVSATESTDLRDALVEDARRELLPTASGALDAVLSYEFEPLERLLVQVVERGSESAMGEPRRTFDRARWSELARGGYRVSAWGDGWDYASRDADIAFGTTEVALHVHPMYWIAGIVSDLRERRPLAAFQVQVELSSLREDGNRTIWPARSLEVRSEEGRFAIAGAPSAAEEIRLVVSAPGYLAETTDWYRLRSRIEDIVVALDREGLGESSLLARTVLSMDGRPFASAKLIVVDPSTTIESVHLVDGDALVYSAVDVTGEVASGGARAETDEEGRGSIATRYAGPARLLVVPPGHRAFLSEPFDLRHGHTTDLGTLVVQAGGAIEGRVWIGNLPDGASISSVIASRPGGQRTWAKLDEEGRFRAEGLEPGVYRVAALATLPETDGSESAAVPICTDTVRIEGSETVHVELHCGSGSGGISLHGRVDLVDGIDDLRIAILEGDLWSVRMTRARNDGTFVLMDVPEGRYTLVAMGFSNARDRFIGTWLPYSSRGDSATQVDVHVARSRVELVSPAEAGAWFSAIARTDNPLFDELISDSLRGTLNEHGIAVLWGLPLGTYRFETPERAGTVSIPAEGGAFRVEL